MKHTPRPWRVGHSLVAPTQRRSVHNANGWMICDASRAFSQEEVEANMQLIAAAPDLLAACKAALPLLEHLYELDSGQDRFEDGLVIEQVENAIAATERQPA